MNYAADWDTIWRGKSWRRLLYRRFIYGPLSGWERDLFLILARTIPERGAVLSVGCGRAILDYWLAKMWGADVHLLDISSVCLRKVHRSFGSVPHRIYENTALHLPFPERTFDLVWNEGVWEHFPEEEIHKGIAEMKRVCRGHVVVDVPYAGCRPYVLAKQWIESHSKWIYGFEDPKTTLQPYFDSAGLVLIEQRLIGSEQTCWNYVNMVTEASARKQIIAKLSTADFQVYPHLVAIGKPKD
jgi:ubiquinone/menaquinone biosynthesis C-methylase UbiE